MWRLEAEFDVRYMDFEVDGRLEEGVASAVDSTEHVVALDLTHDVLHA